MIEKELLTVCLLVAGLACLLYGLINQLKLKRRFKKNEQTGDAIADLNVAQLALKRRVFIGYGLFIISGLVLGFV